MGRGRAKAKQVKVARQLKYNSGGTDLDRLRAELGVGSDQDMGTTTTRTPHTTTMPRMRRMSTPMTKMKTTKMRTKTKTTGRRVVRS